MKPSCSGPPPRLPDRGFFSSGPCAKHPGWSTKTLDGALVGRSHRSKPCKQRLRSVITRTSDLLGLPKDYRLAIMPGSDTGAFEAAMWSLLGNGPVEILAWESFGHDWIRDAVRELKCTTTTHVAEYGCLPQLKDTHPDADLVFTFNGTTSGVCLPDTDWIDPNRKGLTLCDASSAVFARHIDWSKLDATSWSWQKSLGGEAAHGMLALSPRAIERLECHHPPWPVPKLFRIADAGKIHHHLFDGNTINTPSMLCVEDYLNALDWADKIGGLPALIARADANLECVARWVEKTGWVAFLCTNPAARSNTSVTLKIVDPNVCSGGNKTIRTVVNYITDLLESHMAAHDTRAYRKAPCGLRLWCGPTVETADLELALNWIDWAWHQSVAELT